MIEIKIPKEIRIYQDKLFFGLNLRQTICVAAAIGINVPLYWYLRNTIGEHVASWMLIAGTLPWIGIGFIRINGIPFERIAFSALRQILFPRVYVYQTENIYDECHRRVEEHETMERKKTRWTKKKTKISAESDPTSPGLF